MTAMTLEQTETITEFMNEHEILSINDGYWGSIELDMIIDYTRGIMVVYRGGDYHWYRGGLRPDDRHVE